jgi:Mg-chelatase subunit ChlI
MRVNRALDKLQELLRSRGLTNSAASLSILLSANAVQVAPVGLALTISTAAALAETTLATTSTITAAKTIAMTAVQKTAVAATSAVLAGVRIYEIHQASELRSAVQSLQQQQQATPDPRVRSRRLSLGSEEVAGQSVRDLGLRGCIPGTRRDR